MDFIWKTARRVVLGACAAEEFADLFAPDTGYFASGIRGQITGREQWDLPVDPDGDSYVVDLDALDQLFVRGARTLLLTQPHNPAGHVRTRFRP